MTISIAGHYVTQFGELWDKSLSDLFKEALEGALRNSSINPKKIEAIFVANKAGGAFEGQLHLGSLVSELFIHQPPAMRIEGACASGSLAAIAAEQSLLSGKYETVLVIGAEKMTDTTSATATKILSGAADIDREYGSTFPGLYAILAQMHMFAFGTTREMLSSVAVKNHEHALKNPKAQYRKSFTLNEVSSSALVADPLRLLDCSPISDGASAIILTTKKVKKRAKILGYGHAQDSLTLADRKSLTELVATKKAAKIAFSQTNFTPKNIQMAEVHDCFTIAEILAIEDIGFFAKGEGGKATLEGKTAMEFKNSIVINPSGGLKGMGHPVGATGVKQLAILANFIEKGACSVALAHNVGGSGATAAVHILGK